MKKEEEEGEGRGAVGRKPKAGRKIRGRSKTMVFVNLAMGGNPGVTRDRRELLRC
jgi:hypothetical protein